MTSAIKNKRGQSETSQFLNFCQFFEGLGFGIGKFGLGRKFGCGKFGLKKSVFQFQKFLFAKKAPLRKIWSRSVSVSESLVSKTNEAEWQEKDKNKSKDKVIISFAIAMELGMSVRNYYDAYRT